MGVTQKAKPKKAKKKYVPKRVDGMSAHDLLKKHSLNKWVMDDFEVPLPAGDLDVAETGYAICLDKLAHGKGTPDDIGHLGYMVNMALMLCERDIGPEYMPDVKLGQAALINAFERGLNGKTFGCTGDELTALRLTYRLHRAQCEVVGRGHIIAASKEVERRQKVGDVAFNVVEVLVKQAA